MLSRTPYKMFTKSQTAVCAWQRYAGRHDTIKMSSESEFSHTLRTENVHIVCWLQQQQQIIFMVSHNCGSNCMHTRYVVLLWVFFSYAFSLNHSSHLPPPHSNKRPPPPVSLPLFIIIISFSCELSWCVYVNIETTTSGSMQSEMHFVCSLSKFFFQYLLYSFFYFFFCSVRLIELSECLRHLFAPLSLRCYSTIPIIIIVFLILY